jgi:hypothetical protein
MFNEIIQTTKLSFLRLEAMIRRDTSLFMTAISQGMPLSDNDALKTTLVKYRAHVFAHRIRLRELFQDFDPLRSGLMSRSRFIRCISSTLEKGTISSLTASEMNILADEFQDESNMIKWRSFVSIIDEGLCYLI